MDVRPVLTAGLALSCLVAAGAAAAAAAEKSIGQQDYEHKCVMCHGVTGKGDGWFSARLKVPPPPLSRLIKRNPDGSFPAEYVYQVIDGRKDVPTHGPRDMPVWGTVFLDESKSSMYNPSFGRYYIGEEAVRARIRALVDYISTLKD